MKTYKKHLIQEKTVDRKKEALDILMNDKIDDKTKKDKLKKLKYTDKEISLLVYMSKSYNN